MASFVDLACACVHVLAYYGEGRFSGHCEGKSSALGKFHEGTRALRDTQKRLLSGHLEFLGEFGEHG